MKFLVAFVLCLALFSSAFADIWTNCGTSSDLLTIDSVVITPDPPQKGALLTVTASGTLSETVNNGTASIEIKYGIITLYKGTQSICSAKDPLKCPIPAGPLNHTISANIPSVVPAGQYTGSVTLETSDKQEIACINVKFTL